MNIVLLRSFCIFLLFMVIGSVDNNDCFLMVCFSMKVIAVNK